MSRGSRVLFLGDTWHAGGENRSRDVVRRVLIIDYSNGLLRQKENFYLGCPPQVAARFPAQLQELVGYTHHGMGYVDEFFHPALYLKDAGIPGDLSGKPTDWASPGLAAAVPLPQPVPSPAFQSVAGVKGKPPATAATAEDAARFAELLQALPAAKARLPPFGTALHLPGDNAPLVDILAALDRDGFVIIDRAVSEATCDKVVAELEPYLDAAKFGDSFLGKQTKRLGSVAARSPASWEILQHPILMQTCEAILGRQVPHMPPAEFGSWLAGHQADPLGNAKFPFQLSLAQIIRIGSGNRAQPLHRDDTGQVIDLPQRGLYCQVSTIWALDEFTAEKGATNVVPGSHKFPNDYKATREEAIPAIMPKGSVVIYNAHTIHSGGENKTEMLRWALNVDYNIASLRQGEHVPRLPPRAGGQVPPGLSGARGVHHAGRRPRLGHRVPPPLPPPREFRDPGGRLGAEARRLGERGEEREALTRSGSPV